MENLKETNNTPESLWILDQILVHVVILDAALPSYTPSTAKRCFVVWYEQQAHE